MLIPAIIPNKFFFFKTSAVESWTYCFGRKPFSVPGNLGESGKSTFPREILCNTIMCFEIEMLAERAEQWTITGDLMTYVGMLNLF